MDLVDEEHVARFQVGQQRGEIAAALDDRTRCLAQIRPHIVGDDVGEGGLAESRRPEDQHVVERVAAGARRLDEEAELLAHRRLTDVLVEAPGADPPLERLLAGLRRRRDETVVHPGSPPPVSGPDRRVRVAMRPAPTPSAGPPLAP